MPLIYNCPRTIKSKMPEEVLAAVPITTIANSTVAHPTYPDDTTTSTTTTSSSALSSSTNNNNAPNSPELSSPDDNTIRKSANKPSIIRTNPWNKNIDPTTTTTTTNQENKSLSTEIQTMSLASIMANQEQEQQQQKEQERRKIYDMQRKKEEEEEERMIQLALQASLVDASTNSSNTITNNNENDRKQTDDNVSNHNNASVCAAAASAASASGTDFMNLDIDIDDTDLDEDMKLAIQLSLQDAKLNNIASSNYTFKEKSTTKNSGFKSCNEYEYNDDDIPNPKDDNSNLKDDKNHDYKENNNEFEKKISFKSHDINTSNETTYPTSLQHGDNTKSHNNDTIYKDNTTSSFQQELTEQERESVEKAIREADHAALEASLTLALQLQAEEDSISYEQNRLQRRLKESNTNNGCSNVRTVDYFEFSKLKKQNRNHHPSTTGEEDDPFSSVWKDNLAVDHDDDDTHCKRQLWSQHDYDIHQEHYNHDLKHQMMEDNIETLGYRINQSKPSKTWSRLDKHTIIGPNNEIRTKHDITLKHQSNAERILSESSPAIDYKKISNDDVAAGTTGGGVSISDVAYNGFHKSLKNAMKRTTVKGVAAHGHGRAENMNDEKTRGGALDGNVRHLIRKAINNGLIQHCNGVVKEGKEAIVYHAECGNGPTVENDSNTTEYVGSDGFDVAVKVFKRIQEFKGRGVYVDGDPRYITQKFRTVDKREQVELWAEKEFRNLIRANRAGVPVPSPLMQKENVLFMRFLGENGWPAPQLKEIEIKKTSLKWSTLYCQTLLAIRRLYHCAKLVHADLSEYNILVCPMYQVENAVEKNSTDKDSLQIVLIDFGQAVDRRHPSADEFLKRDLTLIRDFFVKQEIKTLTCEESEQFITREVGFEEDENHSNLSDSDNESEIEETMEVNKKSNNRYNIKGWNDVKDLEILEELLDLKNTIVT